MPLNQCQSFPRCLRIRGQLSVEAVDAITGAVFVSGVRVSCLGVLPESGAIESAVGFKYESSLLNVRHESHIH